MTNKTKILIGFFILLTLQVFSQSKFSEIEKFLKNVGYIYEQKIKTEKYKGLTYEVWLKDSTNKLIPKSYALTGTCFFVYTQTDRYIATAEHVAKNTSTNTLIVISDKNDTPHIVRLGNIIKDSVDLQWTFHQHADVGVIQIDESKIDKVLGMYFLPFDMIEIDFRAPFREREVTIYGYPLSLGIGSKISPITKISKPSSGLLELQRFDNKKMSTFYLLDDPSISGFSGGPVFELPQEIGTGNNSIWVYTYRIVGLVHGTISDKGGGFAAVVPSIFIKETIEDAPGLTDTLVFMYDKKILWSKRIYKNGNPWTVISNYNKEGQPQDPGTLKNGNGSLILYDKNSKVLDIQYYENGRLKKIDKKK